MVHSSIKEPGLPDLGKSVLQANYCGHFLHILSKFKLGLGGGFAIFQWVWSLGVYDKVYQQHILTQDTLGASVTPYKSQYHKTREEISSSRVANGQEVVHLYLNDCSPTWLLVDNLVYINQKNENF